MSLQNKTKLFDELTDEILRQTEPQDGALWNPFDGDFDDFPIGEFINMENIRLRWLNEKWFEFIPNDVAPFGFKRSSGEIIHPGRFYTDGGSIPRVFWPKKGLSPWEYGPAYVIHDWEFDLHHCDQSTKAFEEVRDTMMEAVRTLMESDLTTKRKWVFSRIYDGIDSFVARNIWNNNPGCTLPD